MVDVVSWTSGAPTTQFIMECERVSQDVAGNFTRVAVFLRAINRGSTGSYSGNYGEQVGTIDGIGGSAVHSGTPFLPSGYATNAQRWRDGPWYFDIPHGEDGNRGNITLRMRLTYLGVNTTLTGEFWDFPTINRTAGPPSGLTISNIFNDMATLSWARGALNGGTFQFDQLQVSSTPQAGLGDFTGVVENTGTTAALSFTQTGLKPGVTYYVHVRTVTHISWGTWSAVVSFTTLPGARVKVDGLYKNAIPFVKVDGVWKKAVAFQKVADIWKKAS